MRRINKKDDPADVEKYSDKLRNLWKEMKQVRISNYF
jgi:hypothetical protein